jgi:hypothetical protein
MMISKTLEGPPELEEEDVDDGSVPEDSEGMGGSLGGGGNDCEVIARPKVLGIERNTQTRGGTVVRATSASNSVTW